ncbi:MAG: hypothetical protein IJ374_12835, partial [Lachnospiraceae bacterium]|nr:hypothetical protein [Lachnospiraceae bacterium]
AEMVLSKIEYRLYKNSSELNVFIKYSEKDCLNEILHLYQEKNVRILNVEIFRQTEENKHICALFALRMPRKYAVEVLVKEISSIKGIVSVEEL